MMLLYVFSAALLLLALFGRLAPAQAARLGLALERKRCGLVAKHASLPYLEGGSGSEVLVLVHGFGGDKDAFTRIAAYLVPHYRVIIPDLPGFGDARRDPGAAHDMAAQVAHLRQFLTQLNVQRCHLGGSSMGGFVASEYAARHPEQVASLWLLAPTGTDASLDVPYFHEYDRSGDMPLLVRTVADYQALLDACMARPPFIPYCLKRQLALRAVADYALHVKIMRDLTASPRLAGPIRAPALIVWGKQDRMLNPKAAAVMHALMPNSQVVLMDGIGHLPMIEAPRVAARDFLAFQRGLAQAARAA